jgi:transposase
MKTIYTIYIGRLPNGRWKVGCDKNYPNRPNEQGMRIYTSIENHKCIFEASNREIKLQKHYGLSVDRLPYYESIKRSSAGGRIGGKASVFGRPSANRKLHYYKIQYIRNQYETKKYSMRRIAKCFDVSQKTIQNIVNGNHYKKEL